MCRETVIPTYPVTWELCCLSGSGHAALRPPDFQADDF